VKVRMPAVMPNQLSLDKCLIKLFVFMFSQLNKCLVFKDCLRDLDRAEFTVGHYDFYIC
jgi:hypothetical protein